MTEPALPSGWSCRRLKYLATHNDEVLSESTDEEKEIDYVEISGVSLSRGIEEIERMAFGQAPSRARRKVKTGDILISTVRTYLRAIAKVDDATADLIASTGFCVVRPNDDVDSGFLGWVAKSEPFVSQVVARSVGVSYQDTDFERLYAFARNLLAKLPPPGDGGGFVLDDEVALQFFRLQQVSEGSIDLSDGEADPLKGPTDVGTAQAKDEEVTLSSLIDRLNERFGTDFTEADQLFFDQIRASAQKDENIAEAARANSFADFSSFLDRVLDELFIARMEGNEGIFSRVMRDTEFRAAAHEHLARVIFDRVREGQEKRDEEPA